jgi:DNA-binding transcriptional regulator YiaG
MTPADLRQARNRLGLTQGELAARLGVARVSVTRWETGERRLPSMLILALKELDREHDVMSPQDFSQSKSR